MWRTAGERRAELQGAGFRKNIVDTLVISSNVLREMYLKSIINRV
jgi:hypothetical protein